MTEPTRDRTERAAPKHREVASFCISVTAGPDTGEEVWIRATSPGPTRVGSSTACELVIHDRKVSRRHVNLEWHDGRLRMNDLQSTNGTLVNGASVLDAWLHGGEVIRIGETTLAVEARVDPKREDVPANESFGRLVGRSLAMRRLYPLFEKLAAADFPVIIEGETGTGKDLLAETLHELGARNAGPFVVFEVTADAKEMERTLFGEGSAPGAFEDASGGTLLVDDVAELPLVLQAKLLRTLERGEVSRVGGTKWIPVDVRLLVATRRDLDREVEGGNFREDLFYRLAVGRAELPPLRRREDDVVLLAEHFWKEMDRSGTPPPADLVPAEGYHWPGNVRELRNAIARRLALGPTLAAAAAGPAVNVTTAGIFESVVVQNLSFSEARARVIVEFERYFVARTLERHGGNVTRAAAAAGIALRYFRRLKSRINESRRE